MAGAVLLAGAGLVLQPQNAQADMHEKSDVQTVLTEFRPAESGSRSIALNLIAAYDTQKADGTADHIRELQEGGGSSHGAAPKELAAYDFQEEDGTADHLRNLENGAGSSHGMAPKELA